MTESSLAELGQRAKAARVEPVDAPSPDQPDLFEEPAS